MNALDALEPVNAFLPEPTWNDFPTVVVVNETTLLSEVNAWTIAWALKYQVRWQFGPFWQIHSDVKYLPKGGTVPKNACILHLLDSIDEPGALGYHDEDGNEIPYGRVGVKTSQDAGVAPSECSAHECMELLADLHVNLTAFDSKSSRLYPVEVCDAAEGGAYDLGDPYGRKTGILVSNFVLPRWFDNNTHSDAACDYRGMCKGPFSLGRGGYVSYSTTLPPTWQQEFGEHANHAWAEQDERVARRVIKAAA